MVGALEAASGLLNFLKKIENCISSIKTNDVQHLHTYVLCMWTCRPNKMCATGHSADTVAQHEAVPEQPLPFKSTLPASERNPRGYQSPGGKSSLVLDK